MNIPFRRIQNHINSLVSKNKISTRTNCEHVIVEVSHVAGEYLVEGVVEVGRGHHPLRHQGEQGAEAVRVGTPGQQLVGG